MLLIYIVGILVCLISLLFLKDNEEENKVEKIRQLFIAISASLIWPFILCVICFLVILFGITSVWNLAVYLNGENKR